MVVIIPDPQRSELEAAIDAVIAGRRASDLETPTLDFKEEAVARADRGRDQPPPRNEMAAQDIAEAAACFANSEGGVVVIGVDDKAAGPTALVGSSIDVNFLRKRVWELAQPNLTVEVDERELLVVDGEGVRRVRIVMVFVPRGFELHRVGRKLTHRIDTSCLEMSPADQRRVMEERSGYDWSAEPTTIPIDDADPAALARAREMLRESGDSSRDELARQSDGELLRRLGVADMDGRLNNAGVLLFVGSPQGRNLLTYKRRRAPGGDSQARIDSAGPLLLGFSQAKSAIDAVNETRHVSLQSGVSAQIRVIPDAAVREAIINALMHRDYRLPEPVDVDFVGDELVVDSPGGFPPGISPGNIISHPSKPRNRTLTAAFRSLRLAEQEGVGVDRMYREMIRVGLTPPDIGDAGGRVRCVLIGGTPVEPLLQLMGELPGAVQDDVDIALLINFLLEHAQVDAVDAAPVLQKSEREADAAFRRAQSAGLLVPAARSRAWRLSDPARKTLRQRLPYLTTSSDEAERHVIEFLMRAATISNADVCELTGVGPVQGSRILRQLRERNVIAVGSANAKGRGVFYVRGATFEDAARRHGWLHPEPPPTDPDQSLFDT